MEKKKVSSCKLRPLFSAVTESCEIAMLQEEDETNVSGFFWFGVSRTTIKVNCYRDLKAFAVGIALKTATSDCFISFVFSHISQLPMHTRSSFNDLWMF